MLYQHGTQLAQDFLDSAAVVFCDVDNTVCPSAQQIQDNMATAISLCDDKLFVFISGTDAEELSLMLDPIGTDFYILGNSGSQCFYKDGEFMLEFYNDKMSVLDEKRVVEAVKQAVHYFNLIPETPDDQILKRGSQVTLSCLGRSANPVRKEAWDPNLEKRREIVSYLREILDDSFSIKIGGSTSIDILKGSFDKAVGIKKFLSEFNPKNIAPFNMVMVGDKFSSTGNDYPVLREKLMPCINVTSPRDFEDMLYRGFKDDFTRTRKLV